MIKEDAEEFGTTDGATRNAAARSGIRNLWDMSFLPRIGIGTDPTCTVARLENQNGPLSDSKETSRIGKGPSVQPGRRHAANIFDLIDKGRGGISVTPARADRSPRRDA